MCDRHRKIQIETAFGCMKVDAELVELHQLIDDHGWSPPISCQDRNGRFSLCWFDPDDLGAFINVVAAEGSPLNWSLYHCVGQSWWDPALPDEQRTRLEQEHYWTYGLDVFDLDDLDGDQRPQGRVELALVYEVGIPRHHLAGVLERLRGLSLVTSTLPLT